MSNATRGLSVVHKMFRRRTESMLDCRGLAPGPGPVITVTLAAFLLLSFSLLSTSLDLPVEDWVCFGYVLMIQLQLMCCKCQRKLNIFF